jgi:beta-lactamase class A
MEKIVREFPGTMGISVKNLNTGQTFPVNADVRFPTASLIKVAVMVEAYHQIAEGKIRRDTPVTLHEADKAGDETVPLNMLHDGIELTVVDLLNLMIAYSDNTATNLICSSDSSGPRTSIGGWSPTDSLRPRSSARPFATDTPTSFPRRRRSSASG